MAFGSDAIGASFPPADNPVTLELRLLGQSSEVKKQSPRAGFGAGTLSPSGAALKTIKSTFASAKNLVPSLAELRADIREARLEGQAQREQRLAAFDEARANLGFQAPPERPFPPVGVAAVFRQSNGEEQQSPLARIGVPGEAGSSFEANSTPGTPLISGQPTFSGRITATTLDLII